MSAAKPFIPFLLGAAALFWGWQTGNYAIGAILALGLEAPRYTAWRLDLTDADYRRIPDFCSVLFAGVAVLFFVNRGAALGVLSAVQWFPVVVAPLIAAQRLGRIELIRASALFLYVRRQVRRDPTFPDPLVDLSGPYAAILILAAGTANMRTPGYFVGVLALTAWALYALRPRHGPRFAFVLLLALGAGAGYSGHNGLVQL